MCSCGSVLQHCDCICEPIWSLISGQEKERERERERERDRERKTERERERKVEEGSVMLFLSAVCVNMGWGSFCLCLNSLRRQIFVIAQ